MNDATKKNKSYSVSVTLKHESKELFQEEIRLILTHFGDIIKEIPQKTT